MILLDVVMPGLDGLSTMKKLREDSAAPAIIVLTGKATVETAVEAMKNGAFDYLTKPYKLDELVILVNRAHEYGAARREEPAARAGARPPGVPGSSSSARAGSCGRSSR